MDDKRSVLIQRLNEVLLLLNKVGRTYASERSKTIGELQNIIWEAPELQADELYFLQDLAGDLNFYEPVERDRDTELGYYDDARLLEVIDAARKQVQALLPAGDHS